MGEKNIHEGLSVEQKENKEKPTEVARVFLFQSIDPESLPKTSDVEKWNFTNTLLIKKGGTKTTDQLTPVGGKINKKEKLSAAAKREIVEETHLRAVEQSVRQLVQSQEYEMQLPKHEETLRRKVHYFVGQVLPRPMDVPFALDVEEDKISSFVHLDVVAFRQLLASGELVKDGQKLPLLDSLRTDFQRTDLLKTDTQVLEKVHLEVLAQFRKVEAAKKLSVLEHLMWAVKLKEFASDEDEYLALDEERQGIFLEIEDLRKILEQPEQAAQDQSRILLAVDDAEKLWKEAVKAYACTPDEVKRALKNANIEEARDHATERFDFETGAGVPTINFIFPLLISDEADLRERRTLMRNPEMRRLMNISDTFWHVRQVQKYGAEAAKSVHMLANRLKIKPEAVLGFSVDAVPEEVIRYLDTKSVALASEKKSAEEAEETVTEQSLLPAEFFEKHHELGDKINDYFEKLYDEADVKNILLDQHPLIKNASLLELWDLSFGESAALPADPAERRVVRWEASRKLTLMRLLFEAERIQKEVISAGIQEIQNIENALGTFTIKQNGRSVIKEGVFGPEEYAVKTYARQKDLLSFLRKIIVRDELSEDEAMDTFAKSIVLTETSEKALSALKFELCDFEDELLDEDYQPVGEVRMPHFVRELIESILDEAKRQGQLVRIVKYKAFPEDGKAFAGSSGPGATGKIRLGKFYIEHTDAGGMVRNREMQIFLPRIVRRADGSIERVESGDIDFEAKKKDDRNYSVLRLFSTKALRSFMELMYPAEIYGDSIRPIYKAKAK